MTDRPTCPATFASSSTRSRPRSARSRAAAEDAPIEGAGAARAATAGSRRPSARSWSRSARTPTGRASPGTPERVHRMYAELTAGYHVDPERLINGAIFDVDYSEMVVVKDIPFYSLCEHHLLPFFGHGGGRLHPARQGHRAVEDPAHRRDVRAPAPGPGAADPADRRVPPGAARAAGRRRRRRGDPPVRGHARRPQARHDHDHVAPSSACSGPATGPGPSSSPTSTGRAPGRLSPARRPLRAGRRCRSTSSRRRPRA